MFGLGMSELILILIIGLVIFGPGKLPDVGRAVGKSLNEFKKATLGSMDGSEPVKMEPVPEPTKKNEEAAAEKAKEAAK